MRLNITQPTGRKRGPAQRRYIYRITFEVSQIEMTGGEGRGSRNLLRQHEDFVL
jgi:hypothetical protein